MENKGPEEMLKVLRMIDKDADKNYEFYKAQVEQMFAFAESRGPTHGAALVIAVAEAVSKVKNKHGGVFNA